VQFTPAGNLFRHCSQVAYRCARLVQSGGEALVPDRSMLLHVG